MDNKIRYIEFCNSTYVPIYSQPWWLDAVCGEDNWDVWLCIHGGKLVAAMPYYIEHRGAYKYVTKAQLTQNNGIIFREESRKIVKEASFQEKVINEACNYISSLHLDVYEQQYMHTFNNWSPFWWNNYTMLLRYTYIIHDTSDMYKIWSDFSPELRNEIRKGQRLTEVSSDISPEEFYKEHTKIFSKQNLPCPFSYDLWMKIQSECENHHSGKMFCARDIAGNINALLFLIWDDKYVYHLLGGSIPEYSSTQAYSALTYFGINYAHGLGLAYDFEGSMIKRIAKSFREFGGTATPYYRIRKVFNPEIIRKESEEYIRKLEIEKCNLEI